MTGKLALIIEDDFDASTIFATALQVAGYETEVISTGDEAQVRLGEVVPDLILLDLHLPRVVGTELLAQVRADERLQETRIIVASADARMAEAVRADVDLILIKPATFSQVRDLGIRMMKSAVR
ncbi:MAG TPA: response regulator [Phototrophicaceae bacterium]|nr:response regulator [Phototrophicaceae bacterium]